MSASYRVWGLVGLDWVPADCAAMAEVRETRRRMRDFAGASHTIVSVPGEPEYDGDMSLPNGHIVMGRMNEGR